MSQPVITVNLTGLLTLERQMRLLELPVNKRRILLYRIARKTMQNAAKRVRTQTDLDGSTYQARRKPRKDRRKMLSKLIKHVKVVNNDADKAVVGFSNGLMGNIAAKQQYGDQQTINASDFVPRSGQSDFYASRRQAIALIMAGYKIGRGQNKRRPTIRWITSHLKSSWAGVALRQLREQEGIDSHHSWTTHLPARSFLGATTAEISEFVNTIFDQLLGDINGSRHSHR